MSSVIQFVSKKDQHQHIRHVFNLHNLCCYQRCSPSIITSFGYLHVTHNSNICRKVYNQLCCTHVYINNISSRLNSIVFIYALHVFFIFLFLVDIKTPLYMIVVCFIHRINLSVDIEFKFFFFSFILYIIYAELKRCYVSDNWAHL